MTGLDLESFLRALRADLGSWMLLLLVTLGLALLIWSCWGSQRALRKCLVVSLAIHGGLVLYGGTVPTLRWAFSSDRRELARQAHIRQIRVAPLVEPARMAHQRGGSSSKELIQTANRELEQSTAPRWELAAAPAGLADAVLRVSRPHPQERADAQAKSAPVPAEPVVVRSALPQGPRVETGALPPEPRALPSSVQGGDVPAASRPLPPSMAEVDRSPTSPAARVNAPSGRAAGEATSAASSLGGIVLQSDRRLRPERMLRSDRERSRLGVEKQPEVHTGRRDPAEDGAAPGTGDSGQGRRIASPLDARAGGGGPLELANATPRSRGGLALADLGGRLESRSLVDIPRFYQPRVEPNRSTRARRGGASAASELAVERALDWLARHQDRDGRWNGGIARYDDGSAVKGDDDFTIHCPPGETCFGECAYWEADTALTGLALLTYLGAGYTHKEGRYAATIGKGIDFLLLEQKRDGDLRGRSEVVGMYCHAMATLSLCEAYALTGDDRLRAPAERAVAFLVKARARDGQAWRYAPGAPVGDTSILGWVVMGLKSAKEIGIPIPDELSVRRGTLLWLEHVAAGQAKGLARYQPWEPVTPTMTAEAWVCRQFLGVGGPGPSSTEAAESLLRNESDRGPSNFYYWYYATLALYQHGGTAWTRWNAKIRDRIVGMQCSSGHQTGSWEPDGSIYGSKGGRIYCTALAALSLEVYYRYLRLYDEPTLPASAAVESGATAATTPPARSAPPSLSTNPEDR